MWYHRDFGDDIKSILLLITKLMDNKRNSTKEIISKDIQVIFKQGQPFLMKIIFIFKNSQEWFNFLNFMNLYSKETGLFFSES
jgi:hypothetical protein